jgi:hypothetical protein
LKNKILVIPQTARWNKRCGEASSNMTKDNAEHE